KTIAQPPAGRAEIQFERERGMAPLPYHQTGTPFTNTVPESEDLSLSQIVQPPPSLANTQDFRVCVLCARKSLLTAGMRMNLKVDDSSDFYLLGQQLYFAVKGTLAQNYTAKAQLGTEQRGRASNVATIKITGHGYSSGMHIAISGVGGSGYNVDDVMIT